MSDKDYITKDSGVKQEFETGAHRDTQSGKGRYDLIPPAALRRVAGVYQRGAEKYGQRNWERGMPIGRFLDSALRHIYQYIEGKRDEDHLAQAMWNVAGAIHVETMIERGVLPAELNDMPNHMEKLCTCNGRTEKCFRCTTVAPSLDSYKGKEIIIDLGLIGNIYQLAELTPPDFGIMVDVVHEGGHRNLYFRDMEEFEARLVD